MHILFSRNIQDAAFIKTATLPDTAAETFTADFQLDSGMKPEHYEGELQIPELSGADLPNGETLTTTILSGSSASPTSGVLVRHVTTGTGSTIAAQNVRFRLPTGCPAYIRGKFESSASAGDMSAKTATVQF